MIAEFFGDQFEREEERTRFPATVSVVGRVVFEPRSPEIRKTVLAAGQESTEESEHSAVRDHEDTAARVEPRDVAERGHGASLSRFGGLESGWSPIGLQPTGPLRLDLVAGQTLPLASVVLTPTRIDTTRRTRHRLGEQIGGDGGTLEITRDHEVERRALRRQESAGLACLQTSERRERRIGLTLPLTESVPFALTVAHDQDTRDDSGGGAGHDRSRYPRYARHVVTLRLFAQAREVAGTSRDTLPGSTVEEVVSAACRKYGERFVQLLPTCRVWLNGEEVPPSTAVTDKDEVAVLPPVSGGCR